MCIENKKECYDRIANGPDVETYYKVLYTHNEIVRSPLFADYSWNDGENSTPKKEGLCVFLELAKAQDVVPGWFMFGNFDKVRIVEVECHKNDLLRADNEAAAFSKVTLKNTIEEIDRMPGYAR